MSILIATSFRVHSLPRSLPSRVRRCLRHSTTMALPRRSRTLLLLPPPPSTASYAALKTAYNAPISSVLRELNGSTRNAQGQALLEIALPFPGGLHGPRASHYTHVQQLVANLYKLICITASRGGIDTETHDGIDTRVLLVTLSKDGEVTSSKESSESAEQGPVVSLQALARCEKKWDTVYSTPQGGDPDLSILQKFQSVCNSEQNYKQTQGSTAVQTEDVEPSARSQNDAINHHSVAVGGTFDHLHIGHKLLLTMFAFVLSQNTSAHQPQVLTVGITGDALLVNKKYAEHLESWKRRQESTHDFLSSLMWFGRTDDPRVATKEINEPSPNGHAVHVTYPSGLTIRYVEIADPFGPTITDKEITALVLSLETRGGGEAVNNKRKEQGWAPLEVFEVDVLDASEEDNVDDSFQSKLSSTEIRRKRSERLQSRSKA